MHPCLWYLSHCITLVQVWNFLQENKEYLENDSMIIMALMKVHFAQL